MSDSMARRSGGRLDALAAAREELRGEFLEVLPERLAELASAVERAREDASSLGAARATAHKLRGTAGSYGFASLSEAAGRIEERLDALLSGRATAGEVWSAVDAALTDARTSA
jgi:chemotaxis protein histidine kinase CheA